MEAFKHRYNKKSIAKLASLIKFLDKTFEEKQFVQSASKNIESLEMKDRVIQIREALYNEYSEKYKKICKIFIQLVSEKKLKDKAMSGFDIWPLTNYIREYGKDDFKTSTQTLYQLTQVFTAEWALRPFIVEQAEKTNTLLNKWVKDKNKHIRRLVSETTRPHLPWGVKFKNVEQYFERNLVLLDQLKLDDSLYVRKSIANHLQDITHYNKGMVLNLLKQWKKERNPYIDWYMNKALRTLMKKCDKDALKIFGYGSEAFAIKNYKINPKRIKMGDAVDLSLNIQNTSSKQQKYMLDYVISYLKSNDKHKDIVFKWKKIELNQDESILLSKKIWFKKLNNRQYCSGDHFISLQINGVLLNKKKFKLLD